MSSSFYYYAELIEENSANRMKDLHQHGSLQVVGTWKAVAVT